MVELRGGKLLVHHASRVLLHGWLMRGLMHRLVYRLHVRWYVRHVLTGYAVRLRNSHGGWRGELRESQHEHDVPRDLIFLVSQRDGRVLCSIGEDIL